MIAGINRDGSPQLYQIDPSGMITSYRANSIGRNFKYVNEVLEKKYKIDMSLDEGLKLVAECLNNGIDNPI